MIRSVLFTTCAKPRHEIALLPFFAAEKSDALRIVPHADQRITEIGLFLVLLEMQADEPLADEDREAGPGARIDQQHDRQFP